MHHSVAKLRNNLFSRSALTVLGPARYAEYLARFLLAFPAIVRSGDLKPLDRRMSKANGAFRYRGRPVSIDCAYCDDRIHDGTYAFGTVRELLIRDCYFRHQPDWVYESAECVVDLGANRGVFSSLVTPRARFILSVEADAAFESVIRHNLEANRFENYAIEIALVGGRGLLDPEAFRRESIADLLERHALARVDFMKIDIEGSEFDLFRDPTWLERVRALSMELHPQYGDARSIVQALVSRGFACVLADANLAVTTDASHADFLYAWRPA
jgi:hypothetical protein